MLLHLKLTTKVRGSKQHVFILSPFLWVRNPGRASLGPLLGLCHKLQSRCEHGLQSYLKVHLGKELRGAHSCGVGSIQSLGGCLLTGGDS